MKYLLLYITFFTRLPVKYNYDFDYKYIKKHTYLFPVIGLITGIVMYLPFFLSQWFNKSVVILLVWIMYIWVTGGLHIDGLCDTFDGIYSGREKEKILEILKDSRVGTFGVLGLIVIFFSNYIISISIENIYIFIIIPIIGKCAGIIGASISCYARKEGMGGAFIDGCSKKEAIFAYIFAFFAVYIVTKDIFSYVIVLITFGYVYLITNYIKGKIDGMTGDTIGFLVETSQTFFLFFAYAYQQIF